MTGESLPAHAFPYIPEFGRSITGPRDKESGVRSKGQAHDVPGVASESGRLLACLDVPQSTAVGAQDRPSEGTQHLKPQGSSVCPYRTRMEASGPLVSGVGKDTLQSGRVTGAWQGPESNV